MMRIQVDPPRCARFRLIAWICRLLGLSSRWEASGRDDATLMRNLCILGWRRGFVVRYDDHGSFTLEWSDSRSHVVTSL
jgi:hypothetical protein